MDNKIDRGIAARHLLDNELLRECLNNLDAIYHAKWRSAQTVEAREDCHRYVKVIEKLIADLTTIATTGKIEEKRLDELEGKKRTLWPISIAS